MACVEALASDAVVVERECLRTCRAELCAAAGGDGLVCLAGA